MAKQDLADFQEYNTWLEVCERILAKPFPPQDSDFSEEDLERDRHRTFSKFSNWEIICQEILDTRHSHIYYQGGYDELLRRGKSGQEIFDMRKFAWQTVGWLNYPMALWDWVSLDESDILLAIKWLYQYKQIDLKQRHELERFVEHHSF